VTLTFAKTEVLNYSFRLNFSLKPQLIIRKVKLCWSSVLNSV